MLCSKCKPLQSQFCSPMHLAVWQWVYMVDDPSSSLFHTRRCQWCGGLLHTSHHKPDCPVRPCGERILKQLTEWLAETR